MRRVTLYTLKATEAVVGDFQEMLKVAVMSPVSVGGGEAISLLSGPECVTVPIHRVTRITPPTTRPVDDLFDRGRQDIFFAVEPALAEILNAPFKADLEKAKEELNSRISAFNGLPWWRRIWAALKRAL